jgi:hypothetical protein
MIRTKENNVIEYYFKERLRNNIEEIKCFPKHNPSDGGLHADI